MNTELHISQLLYRYQCVIVPGFGAFLSETQSAQLNESSNAFYPPKKLISFNSQLRNNDGLLANHIAETERISYSKAVDAIQSKVETWRNILEVSDRFSVKNIGEFSLNAEKKLVFIPFGQINYLTTSFGLNSFVSPSVKREIYLKEAEAVEEKAPLIFTPEKRKNYTYLKYAALFILSIGLAGTIGYKAYDNQLNENVLAVETDVQKQVHDSIQEATFFIESPLPAVTLNVKEEKMPYHVVAGAFRKEENADRIFHELSDLGYKSKRLAPNNHGLHPVIYESYASYADAYQAMLKIRNAHNPDAWLLIKEL